MKRRLLTFVIACSSACIAVTTLQAQSFVTAGDIPFAFQVGKTTLPAGHYKFSQLMPEKFQVIRNLENGRSVMVVANPDEATGAPQSRVTFHRYGEQYFLSEMQSANGSDVRLPVTAAEQEAREHALPNQEASVSIGLLAQR